MLVNDVNNNNIDNYFKNKELILGHNYTTNMITLFLMN